MSLTATAGQEEGYSRTLHLLLPGGTRIELSLTEGEAKQICGALAYAFGNLLSSSHIWEPIEMALS